VDVRTQLAIRNNYLIDNNKSRVFWTAFGAGICVVSAALKWYTVDPRMTRQPASAAL
jgi:hypothetical protein